MITSRRASAPADMGRSKSTGLFKTSNLLASVVPTVASYFYGGPFSAIVARNVFLQGYTQLYGTPGFLHQWLVVNPLAEHVGAMAYQYGPILMAAVAVPATLAVVHASEQGIQALTEKFAALSFSGKKDKIQEIVADPDLIQVKAKENFKACLEELKQKTAPKSQQLPEEDYLTDALSLMFSEPKKTMVDQSGASQLAQQKASCMLRFAMG